MADIVSDFLTRLAQLAPDVQPPVLQRLEADIRQSWGGETPYVAKRPARMHAMKLGEHLRNHKPLAQCFAEAGISRRHGYRLIGGK